MATKRKKEEPAEITLVDESPDGVARRTFVSLWVTLGFALTLYFLFLIRGVLLLLVIATIFALALSPLVGWLIKKGLGRALAASLAVLVSVIVLVIVISAAASPLISEGTRLINNFPQVIEDVSRNKTLQDLNERYRLVDRAKDVSKEAPAFLTGGKSSALERVKSTFGAVANMVIIIFLTFFLLLEGPKAWEAAVSLLKPRYAKRVHQTGVRISQAVGGYVSGNLLISLIAGATAFVTMLILGIPYPFALAVLVAIFDLIPMVGASIATFIVALVALTQGPVATLIFIAVMIIYQNVEGHVIQPIVYSRTVDLSPLLVLVSTLIGATLGGIVGVLLAIPLGATAQIIVKELLHGTSAGRRAHISD